MKKKLSNSINRLRKNNNNENVIFMEKKREMYSFFLSAIIKELNRMKKITYSMK